VLGTGRLKKAVNYRKLYQISVKITQAHVPHDQEQNPMGLRAPCCATPSLRFRGLSHVKTRGHVDRVAATTGQTHAQDARSSNLISRRQSGRVKMVYIPTPLTEAESPIPKN
jgi:hypothetical protein